MRRGCGFLFLIWLCSVAVHAQGVEAFLRRVHDARDAGARTALVDSLLGAVRSFPLFENDTTAVLLWVGEADTVRVAGEMNGWDGTAWSLTRVPGTTLWYRTLHAEADARIEYKLVADGVWMLDPRNPHTCTGGFGPNSELRMPRYAAPGFVPLDASVPRGRLIDTVVTSHALGNSRTVQVYLPAGFATMTARCAIVVVHDGSDYVTMAQMPTVLDALIHSGRVQPLIAVFIPPVDRTAEYSGARRDAFTAFVADTLLPAVERRHGGVRTAAERLVLGASNGGNSALYMAAMRPDIFANVAAQSSNVIPELMTRMDVTPPLPLRVHLDIGTYDIPVLQPLVRGLARVLAARGYVHRFREHHEGHSWCSWRALLGDILAWYFPAGGGPR
jgi:enterochelin esterase-like enzyme